MTMQSPKHINKPFKVRNTSIGKERRRNMVKETLENQPHFPKTVTYEDIDQAVFEWLDKQLDLSYEGRRLPTFKLFSNQRISEYGQNWKEVDDKGNIQTNFKTITRENNPQHGESQGNSYNIPGNRRYPVFQTKVLEENGDEVIQIYTMKQPFAVNLIYTVSIVTSSYSMLNRMNNLVLDDFKSLEKYIFPNGFAMPMLLNSVGDESDYTIDDRKYYAQSYQVKVMAFIINKEDYEVRKVPSRVRTSFFAGINSSKKEKKDKYNIGQYLTDEYETKTRTENIECQKDYTIKNEPVEENFEEMYNPVNSQTEVEVVEYEGERQLCFGGTEDEIYVNKKFEYNLRLDTFGNECEFDIENNLELESLEFKNVKEYKIFINGIEIQIEDSDIYFNEGDKVRIEYEVNDKQAQAIIKIVCFDSTTIEEN